MMSNYNELCKNIKKRFGVDNPQRMIQEGFYACADDVERNTKQYDYPEGEWAQYLIFAFYINGWTADKVLKLRGSDYRPTWSDRFVNYNSDDAGKILHGMMLCDRILSSLERCKNAIPKELR